MVLIDWMACYRTRVAILCTGCLLFFCSPYIFAQDVAETDTSFYQQALVNARALYHQSFGNQSALYNGSKYNEYPFILQEGNPFFKSNQPVTGSVTYDGIVYDSVLMRYDEINDAVLINDSANWIQLHGSKVARFNLYHSDFVLIKKDSAGNNLVSSGFYNLLYKGKTSLIKKQVKSIREVISVNLELQRFVDTKDYYYLQKGNAFLQVESRKELLKIMGNRKKEMQQFIRSNKLDFKRDKQNALLKATAYYDGLN